MITAEFMDRYEIEVREKELLEILADLVERGEIEWVGGEKPGWRVRRD